MRPRPVRVSGLKGLHPNSVVLIQYDEAGQETQRVSAPVRPELWGRLRHMLEGSGATCALGRHTIDCPGIELVLSRTEGELPKRVAVAIRSDTISWVFQQLRGTLERDGMNTQKIACEVFSRFREYEVRFPRRFTEDRQKYFRICTRVENYLNLETSVRGSYDGLTWILPHSRFFKKEVPTLERVVAVLVDTFRVMLETELKVSTTIVPPAYTGPVFDPVSGEVYDLNEE